MDHSLALYPPNSSRRRSSLSPNDHVRYGAYHKSAKASASTLSPLAAHSYHGSSQPYNHTNLRASYPMALNSSTYLQMEDPFVRPPSLASSRTSASFESRRRSTSTISTTPTSRLSSDSNPRSSNENRRSLADPTRRPVSLWSRSSTFELGTKKPPLRLVNKPGDGWRKIPEEVLALILSMLRESHLQPGSTSCATCYNRDMTNLALSCKKWMNVAQPFLYDRIYFNGPHISLQHKKNKPKHNTRLKLLRRTLRSSPHLARCVRELKPPEFFAVKGTFDEQEHYFDIIASLVMACPKLERLVDFYPMYNNEFSRLFQALFTRKRLASHAWIFGPTTHQQPYTSKGDIFTNLTPPPTPPTQHSLEFDYFMLSHSNWGNLSTLLLHSTTPYTTIKPTKIASYLPSLSNLHISNFPESSFSTDDLLSLRPLKSLTLSSLPGITTTSLTKYATLSNASKLSSLSLLNLNITNLSLLARLFSFLHHLTHFTLQQTHSPSLTAADSIVLHPYLASRTLQHLHWDILTAQSPTQPCSSQILAASIATQGFPALRTIRAPLDPNGHLQDLCRPKNNVLLPRDRIRRMPSASPADRPSANETYDPRLDGVEEMPGCEAPGSRDLSRARLAAQERIEHARRVPKFMVLVEDYSGGSRGNLRARFGLGGHLGTVGSRIEYLLHADGDDEANGGLVHIGNLKLIEPAVGKEVDGRALEGRKRQGSITGSLSSRAAARAEPAKDKEKDKEKDKDKDSELRGCEGEWNREHRKGRKWWAHVERQRGREVDFSKLF